MIFRNRFLMGVFAVVACVALTGAAWAQMPEPGGDKTLSPYFFVKSDDPTLDQLPLKSSSADVKIAGVISDILVTQVYKNEGKRPIEAIYVFPASTRAAVYGLKMTIGTRTIVAKIKKKEEARQEYEAARKAGKSASLLEQDRPNVFTMNVANILPGDEIKVEMSYTELLVPTDGVYEFVYPTVVGPRYNGGSGPQATPPKNEKWVANPYLGEGEKSQTTFDIGLTISAGLPIEEATCDTHKTTISYDGPQVAKVKLDASEKYGGNRDFILKYRLAGGKIESGILLYEGESENFFLMMVQPPKSVKPEQIPGREYIFVVDVSGSMNGFPLNITKKVLGDLISHLRPSDTFNVVLFSGGSTVMSESSLPATEENVQKAVNVIDHEQGGGGTELLPALKRAIDLPRTNGTSRTVVVVTDGYVTVENEAYDLIRQNLGTANLFAFGIGSSVNRLIIEGMARAGMGEPFIITTQAQAQARGAKFRQYIQSPVLTGIKVDYGDFETHAVEPPSIPDVLAERPVIVFGKWKGKAAGTITITGTSGEGEYKQSFDIAATKPLPGNSALRYLWARHRIAVLSDYSTARNDKEIIEEVTQLGLTYNLLTAHTSFVAVDSEVRTQQQATAVNQPSPLPDGVSNMALPSAPFPKQSRGKSYSAKEESDSFEMESGSFDGGPSIAARRMAKTPSGAPGSKPQTPPTKSAAPRITIGGIVTSGGLSADTIRTTFEKLLKPVLAEYVKLLGQQPGLKGKITLEVTLDVSGGIAKASVVSSELNAVVSSGMKQGDLDKLLVKEIKAATFSVGGSALEFTVVFTFEP